MGKPVLFPVPWAVPDPLSPIPCSHRSPLFPCPLGCSLLSRVPQPAPGSLLWTRPASEMLCHPCASAPVPHPFCTCLSIGFCPHLSPSPPAQGGISVTPCPVSPLPVWVHLGGRSGHWAPPRGFVGQWLVSMAPFTPNPAGWKLISSINEPDGAGCSLRFVVLYAKVLD